METHNDNVIEKICQSILQDEYDDLAQNKQLYDNKISLQDEFVDIAKQNLKEGSILEIGCGSGKSFSILPITHGIEPNSKRRSKCSGVEVKEGFAECIPYNDNMFNTVIAWGTWCFVRSESEVLVEVSRVLKIGGRFIFDVVTETNLPLARVNNLKCLSRWIQLFGFDMVELRQLQVNGPHRRGVIVVEKIRNFDPSYLRLPQLVGGKINNYVEERDWFLK